MSKPGELTNYEVGNFVIHRIGENFLEISRDCKVSHTKLAHTLKHFGYAFCELGQDMEKAKSVLPVDQKSKIYLELFDKLKDTVKGMKEIDEDQPRKER